MNARPIAVLIRLSPRDCSHCAVQAGLHLRRESGEELGKLSSRLEITWHCPILAPSDAPQAVRFRHSTFNDRFGKARTTGMVDSASFGSVACGRSITYSCWLASTKPARAKPYVSKSKFVVAWVCWSDYRPSELHRIIIFATFHCGAFPIPSCIGMNRS